MHVRTSIFRQTSGKRHVKVGLSHPLQFILEIINFDIAIDMQYKPVTRLTRVKDIVFAVGVSDIPLDKASIGMHSEDILLIDGAQDLTGIERLFVVESVVAGTNKGVRARR